MLIIDSALVPAKSASMSPTIKAGSLVRYIKAKYLYRRYKKGDIIVFSPPESFYDGPDREEVTMLVKRIDKVSVSSTDRFSSLLLLIIDLINFIQGDTVLGRIIDDGCFYVLGDNEIVSSDSREWGDIPLQNIKGKVIFR